MIGAGIGVTPYASVLKELVVRARKAHVKKVYFLWVCRSQKKFEWFLEVLRGVEEADVEGVCGGVCFVCLEAVNLFFLDANLLGLP